jgi:hypothetical protein
VGLDCHGKFSTLSGCDAAGAVVLREKLDHTDRSELRRRLGQYAPGTPVVLEGTFGCGGTARTIDRKSCKCRLIVPIVTSGELLEEQRLEFGLFKVGEAPAEPVAKQAFRHVR